MLVAIENLNKYLISSIETWNKLLNIKIRYKRNFTRWKKDSMVALLTIKNDSVNKFNILTILFNGIVTFSSPFS